MEITQEVKDHIIKEFLTERAIIASKAAHQKVHAGKTLEQRKRWAARANFVRKANSKGKNSALRWLSNRFGPEESAQMLSEWKKGGNPIWERFTP